MQLIRSILTYIGCLLFVAMVTMVVATSLMHVATFNGYILPLAGCTILVATIGFTFDKLVARRSSKKTLYAPLYTLACAFCGTQAATATYKGLPCCVECSISKEMEDYYDGFPE